MISNNIQNNVITYSVRKTDSNKIFISVENTEVKLTVPSYFTSEQIEQILLEKQDWIYAKLIKEQTKKDLKIVRGSMPYNPEYTNIFGKKYHINLVYSNITSPKLNVEENHIQIILPIRFKDTDNSDLLKVMLTKMYTKILDTELDTILENARVILGIAPEDVEVVKNINFLAKCINGKILINPEIVKFDKETMEYIIFHEFCHLEYKTHSKKFYELIQNVFPNYKKIEESLSDYKY